MKVDLPEPEGPMIATNSPAAMSRITSCRTGHGLAARHVVMLVRAARRGSAARRPSHHPKAEGFPAASFFGTVSRHDHRSPGFRSRPRRSACGCLVGDAGPDRHRTGLSPSQQVDRRGRARLAGGLVVVPVLRPEAQGRVRHAQGVGGARRPGCPRGRSCPASAPARDCRPRPRRCR